MPAYEFVCSRCEVVQVVHPMSEPHPKKCPQCGSKDFHQLFSVPATHASADANWKDEWMPQLGARYLDPYTKTKKNPFSHVNSRAEAIEKFKRRGYDSIEKC